MSRNKYPEKTRTLILEVAKELFIEKGYDQTSIQDIIDGLGGLTKGVVYHHFKSKQMILEALIGQVDHKLLRDEWIGDNGLAKIQYALKQSLQDYQKLSSLWMMDISLKSPSILFGQYQVMMDLLIPKLKKVVKEAILDKSIQSEYPEELAELLGLYMNFMVGMCLIEHNIEDMKRKFTFIKHLFDSSGIPIISPEIIEEVDQTILYLHTLKGGDRDVSSYGVTTVNQT